MDIVGAINHNLSVAGVRAYERHDVRNARGELGCEVGFDIPTRRGIPDARIRAHVPYDSLMPGGVGYEEVGGRLGKKIKKGIKKAAKKVGKLKVVKALVKVAKPLSNLVAPGAAAALTASTRLIQKSAKLVKAAKGGNKKAAKLLTAPLAFKGGAPAPKPGSAQLAATPDAGPDVAQWNADSAEQEAGPAYTSPEASSPSEASEDDGDYSADSDEGGGDDGGDSDGE